MGSRSEEPQMPGDQEEPEAASTVGALLSAASDEARAVVEATYRIELDNLHMGTPPNRQIIADIVSAIQGIVA